MPTLAQLRKNSAPDAATESRSNARETLISDIRSQVRSTEIIERKLQAALDVSRGSSFRQFSTHR
jgi:hypothetical protein